MNNYRRSFNRLTEREERCGPFGSQSAVPDRNTFMVTRWAAGWTKEDIAHALGVSVQALDWRIAKLKKAA